MATQEITSGLIYSKDLMIGYDELAWLQAEIGANGDVARRDRRARAMTTGLVLDHRHGVLASQAWKVVENNGTTIGIQLPSGLGVRGPEHVSFIDDEGFLVYLEADVGLGVDIPAQVAAGSLDVPNDDTWYTVVVRRFQTSYERGTIDLGAGSIVVSGTDTDFFRVNGFTSAGYDIGTQIEVHASDSAQGNEGIYEVDNITTRTDMELTTPALGGTESDLPFTVAGRWFSTPPASQNIHMRWIPQFELVTRTRQPAAGDIILADVKRNDGNPKKVEIIDRRFQAYRPLPDRPMGAKLTPELLYEVSTPFTGVSLKRTTVYAPGAGAGIVSASIAPRGAAGMIVALQDDTAIKHYEFDFDGTGWASIGTIDAGAASHPSIVELPRTTADPLGAGASSLATHACFYVKGGALKMRTWDGASWSAETAVWTPATFSGGHSLTEPHAFLAADGRLWVIASYDDGVDPRLRYVYSDNYGSTWSIAGNHGTACDTTETSRHPRIGQGPDRNLFVTYDDDNGNIKLYSTESETSLAVGDSIVKAISPSAGGTTQTGPAPMWFGSQGQILALCSYEAAALSSVMELRPNYDALWSSSEFGEQESTVLWCMTDNTAGPLWIDMCPGRAGRVHVIMQNPEAAGRPSLMHVLVTPSEFYAPKPAGLLY